MNKKRLLTLMGGEKVQQPTSVLFNGSSTYINCGNNADVQGLTATAFTIEFWAKHTLYTEYQLFWSSGAGKFVQQLGELAAKALSFKVLTDATTARETLLYDADSTWHHWAVCYNNLGDRRFHVYIDGVLNTHSNTAATGTVADISAQEFLIGTRFDYATYFFNGEFGWFRISNNIRYSSAFTPIKRNEYPEVDENTVRLFKMDDGVGTTIRDYSSAGKDATLVNGTWLNAMPP